MVPEFCNTILNNAHVSLFIEDLSTEISRHVKENHREATSHHKTKALFQNTGFWHSA